jgi:hypothetical protein
LIINAVAALAGDLLLLPALILVFKGYGRERYQGLRA